MKFILESGNPDSYARWLSVEGNYSIQRFEYRQSERGRGSYPCDPYYSVYSIRDASRKIGEGDEFKAACDIATHDDIKKYSESTYFN